MCQAKSGSFRYFWRHGLTAFSLSALALLGSTSALAQSDYPNRPVRIIVGFPAGGASDVTARMIGQWRARGLT